MQDFVRTVRLYAIQTDSDLPEPIFKEMHVFQGHEGGLRSVTFSPDGRFIASAGHDGRILLWDPKLGSYPVREFVRHTYMIGSIDFSPDGKLLVSGSWDKTVRIWEVESGKLVRIFKTGGKLYSVRWSPDGKYIVGAGVQYSFGENERYIHV